MRNTRLNTRLVRVGRALAAAAIAVWLGSATSSAQGRFLAKEDIPLYGVGLANYPDYFYEKYNWEDESVEQVMNTRAANSPHSNLFWIAAEMGMVAFALKRR